METIKHIYICCPVSINKLIFVAEGQYVLQTLVIKHILIFKETYSIFAYRIP
jgi:hypothetical protein